MFAGQRTAKRSGMSSTLRSRATRLPRSSVISAIRRAIRRRQTKGTGKGGGHVRGALEHHFAKALHDNGASLVTGVMLVVVIGSSLQLVGQSKGLFRQSKSTGGQ